MTSSLLESLFSQFRIQKAQWLRKYKDWQNFSADSFVTLNKPYRTGCRHLLCQLKTPIPKTAAKIRIHNLKKMANIIEGIIIEPNKVFSFYRILGKVSHEKDYRKGHHFDQDQITHSFEAGQGQLASMIHNICLLSQLEILEHHIGKLPLSHFQLDYIPLGLEACVTWGLRDYRFKNNLPFDIAFQLKISNEEAIMTLYGKENKKFPFVLKTETSPSKNQTEVQVVLQNTGTETRQILYTNSYPIPKLKHTES